MRKYIKKSLLEVIDTIKKANKLLLKYSEEEKTETMVDILTQEQEAAIQVGTELEKAGEMGAVHLLEEYCEDLFVISQEEDCHKRRGKIKALTAKIDFVYDMVAALSEEYDVVFMPYKASMWDCMETVWRAACDDSDCNVYVIPIPYYDRNEKGDFAQENYEGELFPEYVKITSYKEYNCAEKHPEIIYIHNPFDEYNIVTSVHPDFYCSKIKDYTDMLVYIPYFLIGDKLSESHSLLPAYLYADKIILANEQMIETIDKSISREKFIIAGSPKAERLIRMETNKDELAVPAGWKEKIQDRKVVFYNVSITGLLNDKDAMLDKMEEVFQIFENRPELILLYRPHPLAESTLSSMCLELLPRYKQLLERVKKMKNAIYDTTADVGVSVVFSDAYIGEPTSSVVEMFKVVQKPIFFLTKQQYYQPTTDEMMVENTSDVCRVGDDLWFVTHQLQMLCKYNLIQNRIDFVATVPEIKSWLDYADIICYQNKLVLSPWNASSVCVYDMITKSFRKDYFEDRNVMSYFSRAIPYRNYVFFTPLDYPAIVRYDIITGEFKYYDECIKELRAKLNRDDDVLFSWGVTSCDEEMYLTSARSNYVMIFNMENGDYTLCQVGEENNIYRGIVVDGDCCWMILQNKSALVRWDRKTGKVDYYDGYPKDFIAGNIPFKNIVNMGAMLYLIPFGANHICKFSKKNKTFEYAEFGMTYAETGYKSEFFEKNFGGRYYQFGKKIAENQIVVNALWDSSLLVLNVDSMTYSGCPIRFENRMEIEMRRNSRNVQGMYENENTPLNMFLEILGKDLLYANGRNKIGKSVFAEDSHVGENIHKEIKCSIL